MTESQGARFVALVYDTRACAIAFGVVFLALGLALVALGVVTGKAKVAPAPAEKAAPKEGDC